MRLWLALRHCTAYTPQLNALPWAFVQRSTHKQQAGSLMLHAEKKALAVPFACNEAKFNISIELNACMHPKHWGTSKHSSLPHVMDTCGS